MDIYGHRGAKGVEMENSLSGFINTAKAGIEFFELDIRLSSDHQLVVVHDEKLVRLANSSLLVSQTPSSTLFKTILLNTNEGIPKLSDVITACPKIKHWQFEIKTNNNNLNFIPPMKALIEQFDLENKITITSLNRNILKTFKSALPNIPTGYVQETRSPNGIKSAKKMGCSMLVLNKSLGNQSYIKRAQRKGLHVSVWTVNDPHDINKFISYRVNSIISDYPTNVHKIYSKLNAS